MTKTALITGITGQDGAYLAKALLDRGYRVIGTYHQTAKPRTGRLRELGAEQAVELVPLQFLEEGSIRRIFERLKPDEIYNLAAQSLVDLSFQRPLHTAEINAVGALRLLEVMREVCPEARFYQASSSEMFGKARGSPQSETTPFYPCSPYGVAKLFAHWSVVNYREAHGLFACSGILFNHESPLRAQDFIARKATLGLARVALGRLDRLSVGNLEACRDRGFAGDYVDGMWSMLQQEEAGDYVLATGRATSVRDLVSTAATAYGFDLEWKGKGSEELALDRRTGRVIVEVDPKLFRPTEVNALVGDAGKAKRVLGWEARNSLEDLIQMMVKADYDRVRKGACDDEF